MLKRTETLNKKKNQLEARMIEQVGTPPAPIMVEDGELAPVASLADDVKIVPPPLVRITPDRPGKEAGQWQSIIDAINNPVDLNTYDSSDGEVEVDPSTGEVIDPEIDDPDVDLQNITDDEEKAKKAKAQAKGRTARGKGRGRGRGRGRAAGRGSKKN
jgi:hypothetical protein